MRCIGVLALLATGCLMADRAPREMTGGTEADSGAAEELGFDPEEILQRAFDYESEFIKVNMTAVPGTHGDADTVNYFSDPQNEQLFRTIDPEITTQTVSFIEGAMFVKEHLDPNGAVIGFTVMRKARPGYNPEVNDWWWARVSEGNVTHQGKVGFCGDCHVMVENTDFVYGVPLDNRS